MIVRFHLHRHRHCNGILQSMFYGIGWISERQVAYSHSLIRGFHRVFSFPSSQMTSSSSTKPLQFIYLCFLVHRSTSHRTPKPIHCAMDLSKTVVIAYGCSTTVAYIMKGKGCPISFDEEGYLKSTVSYRNGKLSVGGSRFSTKKNEIVLHSTKELLGISYPEYNQSTMAVYDFGCDVECNFDNKPCFRLNDSITFTSEDIASMIIGCACEKATNYLPGLSNVVVTIPSSYSRKQKEELKSAITKAGYRCSMMVPEPSAAVVYFASTMNLPQSTYCVLDLGANSSRISLVIYGKRGIEVLTTSDCGFLCGEVVFSRVLHWLQKELVSRGVDSYMNLTGKKYPQLLSRCEEMVKELCEMEESFFDPRILSKPASSFSLSQTTLKQLLRDDCGSLLQQVRAVCNSLPGLSVQTVLVVGAMAKSFVIQELLGNAFSFKYPLSSYCVADGCMTYLRSFASSRPYTLVRRLACDVGIGVSGNSVQLLMKRGTPIPCKVEVAMQRDEESSVVQTGVFVRDREWELAEMLIFPVEDLYYSDGRLELVLEVDVFGMARVSVTDCFDTVIFSKNLFSVLCCRVCSQTQKSIHKTCLLRICGDRWGLWPTRSWPSSEMA